MRRGTTSSRQCSTSGCPATLPTPRSRVPTPTRSMTSAPRWSSSATSPAQSVCALQSGEKRIHVSRDIFNEVTSWHLVESNSPGDDNFVVEYAVGPTGPPIVIDTGDSGSALSQVRSLPSPDTPVSPACTAVTDSGSATSPGDIEGSGSAPAPPERASSPSHALHLMTTRECDVIV